MENNGLFLGYYGLNNFFYLTLVYQYSKKEKFTKIRCINNWKIKKRNDTKILYIIKKNLRLFFKSS
jgi:hypothetical protein